MYSLYAFRGVWCRIVHNPRFCTAKLHKRYNISKNIKKNFSLYGNIICRQERKVFQNYF